MRFRVGARNDRGYGNENPHQVRNDCAFYSPPLEGWLTKEDGVVLPLLLRTLTRSLVYRPDEIPCRRAE
ncbi:MAG: hypothetical protein M9898_05450 [Chitinophagaceae bacterium]|nr:hypothetical protein [Chitinophagaceae bacterium]